MSSYLGVPPQSGFITTAKQRVTSSTNNYVDLDHSISSLADVIVWVNFVKQDSTNLTLTTSTFSYNYSTNIGILTGTLATSIPSGTRIDNTPFSIAHNTVSGVSNGVPSSIDLGSNSITGGTGGTTFKIEGIANLFEVPTGYNVGDRNAVGGDIPY